MSREYLAPMISPELAASTALPDKLPFTLHPKAGIVLFGEALQQTVFYLDAAMVACCGIHIPELTVQHRFHIARLRQDAAYAVQIGKVIVVDSVFMDATNLIWSLLVGPTREFHEELRNTALATVLREEPAQGAA